MALWPCRYPILFSVKRAGRGDRFHTKKTGPANSGVWKVLGVTKKGKAPRHRGTEERSGVLSHPPFDGERWADGGTGTGPLYLLEAN